MRSLLLAALLLVVTGCQTQHGAMMEAVDTGRALEKEARALERSDDFAAGATKYTEASGSYSTALGIAEERQNQVFASFITTKLSIVHQGKARCLQPDNNPAGDWNTAFELYDTSAKFAQSVSLLKLKGIARSGQAHCVRPDNNPAGEWPKAAALYAEAADLAKRYEGDEERGVALRQQAVCLLEGDTKNLSRDARRLLERARDLGDEDAAHILSSHEGRYCRACGEAIDAAQKFCGRCGHDQSKSPTHKSKVVPPEKAPPRHGPGAPNGPGGGPG